MIIGSILIGGIERVARVLLRDFEIIKDTGDRMGSAKMLMVYDPDSEPVVGTAECGDCVLGSGVVTGQLVEVFASNEGTEAGSLWGEAIFGEPLFGEATTTHAVFRGTIVNLEREVMVARGVTSGGPLFGEAEFGGPLFGGESTSFRANILRIECRDWNSILENAIVEPGTAGFTAQTDAAIIASLFAAAAPSVDLTNVSATATISTFAQVENQTLRTVLGRLAELTGAIWYIDAEKALHWFLPTSRPAPFSLAEEPDYASSFPFDRDTFRYSEENRNPANQVTVLGEVSTGGVRIRETVSEPGSIAAYGLFGRTISDRSITSSAQAKARGRVELANYAYPQYNGLLTQRREGLEVGQYLSINCATSLHLNNSFTVRRIRMTWWNRGTTNYEIEWGAYRPDLARAIRAIYDMAQNGQPPAVQPTTPATGSVGSTELEAGAVQNVHLGSAVVDSANIANGAIRDAHIGTAEITSAKISSLDADKINTGYLLVGGSNATVLVGSTGSPTGWIGSYGGDNGGWFQQLYVGGTGPSSARLVANSSGSLSISLGDGEALTVDSVSNNRVVQVTDTGFIVNLRSNPSIQTIIVPAIFSASNGTGGEASIGLSGGSGSGVISINGLTVINTRKTGWSLPTGTSTRTGFATGSATTEQVAEALKALLEDLHAYAGHGLIGS